MRLLLVEDQADLAANVADHLAGLGHDVQLCADGETAFSAARNGHLDMLILDVMLPRLDGLSVCRSLRQEGLEQLPILMLTARDSVEDRVAGLDAGADDYLVKPFALAELEARVRALLRRVQPAPTSAANATPEVLQVADLTFDPATLVAERSGQVLRLNPSTRRILQILLQNTQRVVTRQELEAALWGDSPPTGDVLRAHMYALRVAVDKPFDHKLLHTVHGEGYRLAVLDEA
jgi:DNA-binding response OmpR family regulator